MPLALGVGGLLWGPAALGNPTGLTVVSGSATTTAAGPTTTVNVSDRAVLNWQSFNLAAGETTIFNQPSAASIVWNQVLDPNPSRIFGNIQANGIVVLANTAGFWFGPDSVVKAASFVATTAGGPPPGFDAGGAWNISYAPPLASIINYGQLEAAAGGSVFLVAEKIANHGILMAPDGNIGLYAGKEVLVSERPDARGLSAKVSLPSGSVDNHGKLIADAGSIALHAQVVNQGGLVRADSVRERNGVIELIASDGVALEAGSETLARGGTEGVSPGGQITVKAERAYHDDPAAKVSVAGGTGGGDGGQAEISAEELPRIRAQVDGAAGTGFTAGQLLIDPNSIVIAANGTGTANSGTVGAGDLPNQLTVNPAAFASFSQITLQARTTIDVNTAWNLPDMSVPGAKLVLEAGTDLRFGNAAAINAGLGWDVELLAGKNFTTGQITSGVGSVLINSAGVSAQDGSISIRAGKDVTVTRGFVHTLAGGDIAVSALAGSINAGTGTAGYIFSNLGAGYRVNDALSGISTGAGGDVTLTAGKDVTSYLPTQTGSHQDAGSGAFGAAPGDVTITAGGSVYGHYVLANGAGRISTPNFAGDIGNKQLALTVARGSWEVSARDITLQEVRNANGVFNGVGSPSTDTYHLYDYSPDSRVSLTAANGVTLLGGALPRNTGGAAVPVIYPPSLKISAGAGGVLLGANLTLFPSPVGQLDITTTAGGSLGARDAGRTYQLTMSDSDSRKFTFVSGQFGPRDHGDTLLHLDDLEPGRLNIAGNLANLVISLPKRGEVRIGGDLVNAAYLGQNLRPDDETLLDVAGDIRNVTDYSFVQLPEGAAAPRLELLGIAEPPVGVRLGYDSQNRTVALRGRMTAFQRDALLNFTVLQYVPQFDPQGVLQFGPDGLPLLDSAELLPPPVITALFEASQGIPDGQSQGYQLAGPGRFTIRAHNIDLGVSRGILTAGAQANEALAPITPKGAAIRVETTGDLTMFSSAIVSKAGGDINVSALGDVIVGAAFVAPNSDLAQGIYTTAGSDVTVVAQHDISLNGSRIASYDGGNLLVKSLQGNVDAGSGGLSLQNVEQVRIAAHGKVVTANDYIPGSGILATTFSSGSATVGDIAVETPRGNILARAGGVVQASFNESPTSAANVTLVAGTKAVGKPGDEGYVPAIVGMIDASKSGVIGGNVSLDATGDIVGVVFASGNANIITPQNVNATVLAQGSANVSGGGTVAGTIVGIGSASVSGTSIDASVLSQNATTSGNSSGQVGFATANVAGASAQAAAATSTAETKPTPAAEQKEEEDDRRKAAKPVLARTVGRVTVVLPPQGKPN
jgi:filamentous hemagglutinin family protein